MKPLIRKTMKAKSNRFRLIYIIIVAALIGGYFTGGATGFRLLSAGATISAVVAGPALIRHK